MKEIELMEHVLEEMSDAYNYAKMDMEYKDFDAETAELLYKLSGEEVNHANALHKNVVRMIDAYHRSGDKFPEDDMAVYEYLHKRAIEKAGEVGALQGMYRR